MDVYMYAGGLWCEDCASAIRSDKKGGKLDREDSEEYPQGPFPDGGGEADVPNCCDGCQCFLENPLTSRGYEYVADQLGDKLPAELSPIEKIWADHYGFEPIVHWHSREAPRSDPES